jgi:LETM1 and EF-hand domain-containing protein 1, mitochondrial
MIQAEGVESLSEYELRQACRERGHLGLLSTEEMRLEVCSVLLAHPSFFYSTPHYYIRFQILFVVSKRNFAKSDT